MFSKLEIWIVISFFQLVYNSKAALSFSYSNKNYEFYTFRYH